MIIGTTGATKTGKSTFIKDFVKKFPRYGQPAESYRDIPNLDLYENGTEESQRLIRDFMFKQAQGLWQKRDTNRRVIMDRTLLDNLAVTMFLYSLGADKISDGFLAESIEITKRSMEYYHMIYFIPIDDKDGIEVPEEINDDFRRGFDNLLNTFYMEYATGGPLAETLYPTSKCAFIDEVTGSREARIDYVSEILDENGDQKGGESEDSLDGSALGAIVGADGMPAYSEDQEFDLGDFGFQTKNLIVDEKSLDNIQKNL
jgi:hypothetical protein